MCCGWCDLWSRIGTELVTVGDHEGSALSPRVLIVDDEVLLLRTLSNALREGGFDVLVASSAEEAERELSAAEPVDLLVLDVKLPGKSGLDLLRERRDAGFRGKAVVMTAFDSPDSERVCRSLVVDHYLRKPFDLEQLLELVRALTANGGQAGKSGENRASSRGSSAST
ncbi:MAG: response regulator [Candidatus Eisenbacteria bacterium]|nr:response regulator [Candidatus Latescibacterota bacterium]MBD3301339.1 response regulator [Candidatus Eisenbacteria bacterium]